MNAVVESRIEGFEREDLVMFINACFACTGQREFYSERPDQQVSVDFLHQYTVGNYRRLYARTLAVGVNHFNQAMIIQNLLAAGSPADDSQRLEENALITAAIEGLPPQRVYRLFEMLQQRRVNNRRTRAVMKRFIASRDVHFDAVKYRRKLRHAGRHAHVRFDAETTSFLSRQDWHGRIPSFETPIFKTFLEAHYSKEALFSLPFTVAEGLAESRGISRRELLDKAEDSMTAGERLRVQSQAKRHDVSVATDLSRTPLTRLAVYICSLDPAERAARHDELDHALTVAAERSYRRAPSRLGRVAVIADRSFSTTGSYEKRRRPLAVTLAAVYLLQKAADDCHVFWAPSLARPHLEVTTRGQTDLATATVAALRTEPDTLVIVSDGYENAPSGLVSQVIDVARSRIPAHTETSGSRPMATGSPPSMRRCGLDTDLFGTGS